MTPLLMAPFIMPVHASEQSGIRNRAVELRLTIARFEQNLQHSLRDAINTTPDQVIDCKSKPRTLLECLKGPYHNLMQIPITISKAPAQSTPAPHSPLQDLDKVEERFAIYTDRVNAANDLLSRAGAPLFVPARNLTPDMDDLRKRVLAYMQDRRSGSLWREKIVVFVSGFAVLCAVFGMLYFYLRRFRG
ncbi:hypothetical protein [Thalassospira sp. TSL5-1]|uniref:hypothetical protein n=1 Tax=Thalassospira sp. TSL5-1 TaxID=1544451 RepID=UPI00116134A8|nr:hypothetical protein [Thalassospira sp. TSL5-1]